MKYWKGFKEDGFKKIVLRKCSEEEFINTIKTYDCSNIHLSDNSTPYNLIYFEYNNEQIAAIEIEEA